MIKQDICRNRDEQGTLDEKELKWEQQNRKQPNGERSMLEHTADGWHRDICRGIIMAYFLVIAAIYPFYAPGGYTHIGEVKFELFRNVSLVTLAVAAVVILLSVVIRRDWEWVIRNYRQMSVTDWFAYGYFVMIMLSYLCSSYKEDALWGVEGWRMGVITQMIFIVIYFLFSRYFHCDLRWIGVWLSAAAAVFLLGICNRYSFYPIAIEGQTATFISTLGNINWFCGYWSVTAPLGITLYWCSDRIRIRIAAGIYSVIAMLSGVTQGSESAYLVFAAVLIILFVLSFHSAARMYRFLELWMMFAGSCMLAKLLMRLPGFEFNYMPGGEDNSLGVTGTLLFGNVAVWIFLVTLACYIFLRIAQGRGLLQIADYMEKHSRFKGMVTAAVIAAFGIAGIILLNVSGAFDQSGVQHAAEVQGMTVDADNFKTVFRNDWGNGRGAAWNSGINAYQSMNTLHKIVGVGPDCFADYVYSMPELADRLVEQFSNRRLVNAHNEQLTILVNNGTAGWLCFAGLFLTAFVRYIRKARSQPMLYLCAVSMLAYTMHNLVSFQQILSAPYIFIVTGIGEKIYRSTAEGNVCDYMGNRIASEKNEKAQQSDTGLKMTSWLAEILFAVLAIVMCVVLALYAKDGYYQIGEAKFTAYKNVMMIGCSTIAVVTVAYTIYTIKNHQKYTISVTDGCVLAYLVLSCVAAVAGGFYEDVLWGFDGWNMGLMSQLSFVLLYFFASRFGKHYRLIIVTLLAVSCVVYGLGILHRLLIDPIGFYDGLTDWQKSQFLSTLGQSSWYGSFLAVTLPVGMGVFLYSNKKLWTILGGIFMTIGFCTLVTQNSDSAYFGLAGALIVFIMISAKERGKMYRFMLALTLFFASAKVMYFLMLLHPNPEFKADFVTKLMWTSSVTWVFLMLCIIVTAVLYFMGAGIINSHKYPGALMARLCRFAPAAAGVVVVGMALVIILQAQGALPQGISDRLAGISYFNWGNEWGNGRGRIWSFGFKMFAEANLKYKLFGVGPDCFNSYLNAYYGEEAARLWIEIQLTNAHNEWLTSLVNVGIIGTAAYLGIYVTAIRRFFREQQSNFILMGIAAAIVSYMCYNFFCYQQVLCTPFVFLLMGIGEYIWRESRARK